MISRQFQAMGRIHLSRVSLRKNLILRLTPNGVKLRRKSKTNFPEFPCLLNLDYIRYQKLDSSCNFYHLYQLLIISSDHSI